MMTRERYSLLKEIFGTKRYEPYELVGKNEKLYTPYFYGSDLQLVPEGSTGFTVTPSTARVEYINSYDNVRKDAIVKENEASNVIIKAVKVPKVKTVVEPMVTRSKRQR